MFDFCGNYRKKIVKALLKQFNLKVDESTSVAITKVVDCSKRIERKKKNCFEKLVTQILTNERKNINKNAIATIGISWTIQRPGVILTEENDRLFRRPRRFYKWMLMGEFVSKFIFQF